MKSSRCLIVSNISYFEILTAFSIQGLASQRKREAALAQDAQRRAERDAEANKLRAERSEMEGALHAKEAAALREELSAAHAQLESMRTQLPAPAREAVYQLTLRGKNTRARIADEQQRVGLNLAALTAELEALELSNQNPHQAPTSERAGQDEEADSGLSDLESAGSVGIITQASARAGWQSVVGELAQDNALLQQAYLDLLQMMRSKQTPGPTVVSQELAAETAARARAERALREALQDKKMLEQALVAQIHLKNV